MGVQTGIEALDRILCIDSGIITLRSSERQLLSGICDSLVWRNIQPPKKTLVLHFADYHDRYWSVNFDGMVSAAKREGRSVDDLLDHAFFLRVFSRDGVESEGNWRRIIGSCNDLRLVVLDSVSDLYLEKREKPVNLKAMLYMIGMFGRLCAKNCCLGVALDCSEKTVHPYLGELSSIVANLRGGDPFVFELLKHPMQPDGRTAVYKGHTLARWLG